MFVAAIMTGTLAATIPYSVLAEEPKKENSTLVDVGVPMENKEDKEADKTNKKEDMNVAGYGNKAKVETESTEKTKEKSPKNPESPEVKQKTEPEPTTQEKNDVHNEDVNEDITKDAVKSDVDEVEDSAYLQYEESDAKPEDEKDKEPWFHISFKDIVFQLITAMIIFVIPGYVIFWRSKHK